MLRGRALVRRSTVAVVAVATLSLAACGAGSSEVGDADLGGGFPDASDTFASSRTGHGKGAKNANKNGQERLKLGETAEQPTEFTRDDTTGRFKVSVDAVEMGKPGSLDEASSDPDKFKGKIPAWVRMTYTHVGGGAPVGVSTTNDWGVKTTNGERGKALIMIRGEVPGQPEGCRRASEVGGFRKGQKATLCQPFVVPEGSKPKEVLLSRGFTTPPTSWSVK